MAVKIVDKELALKLKELGFDMPVNRYYSLVGGDDPDCVCFEDKESNFNNCYFKHEGKKYPSSISAPTYDEVLHWLRDKHELYGCVFRNQAKRSSLKHIATLNKSDDCEDSDSLIYEACNSYEDAQLIIINKAIELLEEQLKTKEHG